MAASYEKIVKRVSEVNESVLAELIEHDVQQLTERALDQGVTAYLERPVQRVRPNERFLQTTIRNVAGSNRREQEAQLWEAHRSHQRLISHQRPNGQPVGQLQPGASERTRHHPSSAGARSGQFNQDKFRASASSDTDSTHSSGGLEAEMPSTSSRGQEGGMGEHEMAAMLSSRRVKGRGAVGSRADEPGPYLPRGPVTSGLHGDYRDSAPAASKRLLGPPTSEWLRQIGSPAGTADEAALLSAAEFVLEAKRAKRKSKHKNKCGDGSKHKSKKRRKHKS